MSDMERMDYGFRLPTILRPRAHYPDFNTQRTFQGDIWVLVSSFSTSAAQVAAWATKETGFATLVGEISGGAYGG